MPKHCAGLHITLSKETISYSQTDFAKRWGGANLFANDIMLVGLSLDDMVDTIHTQPIWKIACQPQPFHWEIECEPAAHMLLPDAYAMI